MTEDLKEMVRDLEQTSKQLTTVITNIEKSTDQISSNMLIKKIAQAGGLS